MKDKKTTLDRALVVDNNFIECIKANIFPPYKSTTTLIQANLTTSKALEIFKSQLESRHLDLIARKLKNEGKAFYTIGSSGHEGNAAIAAAFAVKDMAFLHYRSAAFMLQRAREHGGDPLLRNHLLALVASIYDPIASGRHKVFGSLELNVPPQTSTIGSHAPKALGAALSISVAKNLNIEAKIKNDAVILCSFGDGSINHSTVQGSLNTAQWIVAHNLPLPIVFICEDNALAISVPTAEDWIYNTCSNRLGITYIACDGLNIADTYKAALNAANIVRRQKKPVFLHFKTVRILGHAGSDIEFHYNTGDEILKRELDDPLLHTAKIMLDNKILTNKKILELYEQTRDKIKTLSLEVVNAPKHVDKLSIMRDIIPPKLKQALPKVGKDPGSHAESEMTLSHEQSPAQKYNMAQLINMTLDDLLAAYNNIVIFGEDVGKKGGVYRVTANLQKKYSAKRVFDSLLDEQTILGTAIGFAHNNILPIPEIQFLAYLHNAIDQIRGEAATLSFFSSGQFTNPMIIRVPGLAYQRGFGGHFHNDNAISFLREIPGIIIACPSSPTLAALMLRRCVALAYQEQRVVIFLEPIALYHQKDLYEANDNEFLEEYPSCNEMLEFGAVRVEGNKESTIAVITFGNGVILARKAQKIVRDNYKEKYNVEFKIIDLCWLAPINIDAIQNAIKNCKNVIIVDETRNTGSIADTIIADLYCNLKGKIPKIHKITAEDCFIPLGDAWQYVLPSVSQIVDVLEKCFLAR